MCLLVLLAGWILQANQKVGTSSSSSWLAHDLHKSIKNLVLEKITEHHLTPNGPPQNFAWCSEMVWTSSWIHIAPLTQEGKIFQLGPENT